MDAQEPRKIAGLVTRNGGLTEGDVIDEQALPPLTSPHPSALLHFSIGKGAERFAYWGARTMLIYYLMERYGDGALIESFSTYNWLLFAFVFAPVLGGLLTDLLVNTRNAIVWGGLSLAVGYFVLGFGTWYTDLAGGCLILGGAAFYNPASYTALGRYYRGRQQFLLAGMHVYTAAMYAGMLLSTILFGVLLQYVGWRQGLMLCGIVMILGHIYLLVISRVFTEPYLPEMSYTGKKHTGIAWLPLLAIATYALFYMIRELRFDKFAGVELEAGFSDNLLNFWFQYYEKMLILLLLLAGAWMLTRDHGNAAMRIGVGAILGILILVPGIEAAGFAGMGSGTALSIISVLSVSAGFAAAEILLVPAIFSIVLRHGTSYPNTWIGLITLVGHLPVVFVLMIEGHAGLEGTAIVLSTIALATAGLWFIKNKKIAKDTEENPA